MYFDFIKHSECSKNILEEICQLKSQYWHYPLQEQLNWININLSKEDIHLILKENENEHIIAYLNISKGKFQIDNSEEKVFFGIGNVCVDKNNQKKEFGFLIMKIAEFYIRKNKGIGLLLCKEENILFYKKNNWTLFEGNIIICNKLFDDYLFYYNTQIIGNCIVLNKVF